MAARAFARISGVFVGIVALAILPQPAEAQSLEDLDKLVTASAKPKDGMALAQAQIGAGALLDALATLKRVLAIDPKNKQARLLHASVLCRVDDADGAALEFSRLKSRDYKKAEWAGAIKPCAALSGAAQ